MPICVGTTPHNIIKNYYKTISIATLSFFGPPKAARTASGESGDGGLNHPTAEAHLAVVQHRALPRGHGPLGFRKTKGKTFG